MLSVASAVPRNIESVRVNSLIPPALQTGAKNLVNLLEYYYDYLNTTGFPSTEIASISSLKDIDVVSMRYLDQIEGLIGKNIPQSRVLNRIELYKIIVRYYNTRGSEDSIHSFFKIFYNQIVEIIYPKDHLFDLSGGTGHWTQDSLISPGGLDPYYRELSDEDTLTVGGILIEANETNGAGQLVSIRIKNPVPNTDRVVATINNGVITVTPGEFGRLGVAALDVTDGIDTWPIPDFLYCTGLGLDGRPVFSSRLDFISEFTGTPTRCEWDGSKWDFIVGSPTGDVTAFFSEEDVDSPDLVTTWLPGWEIEGGDLEGEIYSITRLGPINAQLFNALTSVPEINEAVTLSTNILGAEYTEDLEPLLRTYLTSRPLPTAGVEVLTYAIVNGHDVRPFVVGVYSVVGDETVWNRSADVDEQWIYEDHKSFLSDDYKLFDGYYWQDFSYVIRSDLDSAVWHDEYLKFVHPAGLKLFSAIVIEIVSRNEWLAPLDYTSDDIFTDDSWLKSFIPPHNINADSIGYHTPRYQPGFLRDQILRYLFAYTFDPAEQADYVRLVLFTFKFLLEPVRFRNTFVREQYQGSEKFIDTCELGAGLLDRKIFEVDEEYSNVNNCRVLNLSAIIDYGDYVPDPEGEGMGTYSGSSYEVGEGDGSGTWSDSFYDDEGGEGSGTWDDSYLQS